MRKLFHIFLVFFLLLSTTGFAVSRHFCGELLAHVSLSGEPKSCCGAEEEEPSDCGNCQDEVEHVVVEDDFQQDHQQLKLSPIWQASLVDFFSFLAFAPLLEETNQKSLLTLKYPPFTESDIHIRLQSFLI